MQSSSKAALQAQVESIAKDIQNGKPFEICPDCGRDLRTTDEGVECPECVDCGWSGDVMYGFEYLSDALDIQYIVSENSEYIAARILVAFGGPNIWINTQNQTVEGYWWGESAFASYFADEMGIDETCRELWACR